MDKDFDKAIGEERDRFVKAVRDQEWNTQLRTAAENILIMYDQMRDRLSLREQPLREAIRKMDKVIKCLAIELPEAVLKSVVTEWEEFKQTALAGEGDGIYLTKSELEKKISDAWDAAESATMYAKDVTEVKQKKKKYLKSIKCKSLK